MEQFKKFSNQKKRAISLEIVYCICMILIGTVLALALSEKNPQRYKPTIFGLEALAAAGLGLLFYLYLTNSNRHVLKSYLAASLLSCAVLMFAAFH